MLKTACAALALITLANPALAASCTSVSDAAALKTAVMQQELMVAALQCHESGAYNRFVTSYRDELQASDATLKSFFVRRGGEHGEAGYDAFKTKAANLSALEEARDATNFCADAHALFAAAMNNHASLASFVDARASDVGNVCAESRPVTAAADRPPIAAPTKTVAVVKIADTHAEKPAALVKVAAIVPGDKAVVKARTVVAGDTIGGVPDHAAPMMPWRHAEAARAAAPRDDYDDEDYARPRSAAARDEDLVPARATQIRDERADDGYYGNAPYADRPEAPRADDDRYGPPQGWTQPPRYRQPGYGW
jgi:hypothetical protein